VASDPSFWASICVIVMATGPSVVTHWKGRGYPLVNLW